MFDNDNVPDVPKHVNLTQLFFRVLLSLLLLGKKYLYIVGNYISISSIYIYIYIEKLYK